MGSCGDIYLEEGEGGVYFSSDYGASWSHLLTGQDIQALAIDPYNSDRLMAGTMDGKLFTSTNGGNSWTERAQLNGTVTQLYFNHHVAGEAWAITSSEADGRGYLYHSTNLVDWILQSVDVYQQGPFQAQMDFLPGSVWIASGGVYYSTNSGTTWDSINSPLYGPVALAIAPNDPQTIFVGTDFGVEVSENGGSTWTERIEGLAAMVPNAMAVSRIDSDTVYVQTNQGIFASQNGGYDWQYLDYGSGGFTGQQSLAIDPFDEKKLYFIGTCEDEFCIDISMDGGSSWKYFTSALPPAYAGWSCSSFTILPSPHTQNRILVGASLSPPGSGDVQSIFFTSSDGGATWNYVIPTQTLGYVSEMVYDAINPALVYASTEYNSLLRSTNGGENWSSIPVADQSTISVAAIAVHPNITNKVYVRTYDFNEGPNPESKLWYSENAGISWQSISEVFTGADLLVAPPLPNQFPYSLFTGGAQDQVENSNGLYRSYNDGQSWQFIPGAPRPIMLAAATDGERSIVYISSPGGLASGVGSQAMISPNAIQNDTVILGGGVYRLSVLLPSDWVYLPSIMK
jgi:photosystem II stability/assembly factor-like uncharacterized protein